jgi:hypothetical protein
MVSFTELVTLIQPNKTKEDGLPVWTVVEPVRIWKLPVLASPPIVRPEPPSPVIIRAELVPVLASPPIVRSEPPSPYVLRPYGRALDILSIGIADILYYNAPSGTARQIEKEEAIRIEAMIPSLYSSEGGRSRGWTKKSLEFHLRSRAAIGGDLFDLRKVKATINGNNLFTCKETSALFDFFCLAKGIRCAVWKDPLHFGFWPAAEPASLTKEPTLLHIHLNETGDLRLARGGPSTIKDLFAWVDSTVGAGWIPALSCLSILATNTLEELKQAADAIGITVTGKKSEQVVQIAAARRRRSCSSFTIE